jgi:hypothetical protein
VLIRFTVAVTLRHAVIVHVGAAERSENAGLPSCTSLSLRAEVATASITVRRRSPIPPDRAWGSGPVERIQGGHKAALEQVEHRRPGLDGLVRGPATTLAERLGDGIGDRSHDLRRRRVDQLVR